MGRSLGLAHEADGLPLRNPFPLAPLKSHACLSHIRSPIRGSPNQPGAEVASAEEQAAGRSSMRSGLAAKVAPNALTGDEHLQTVGER